MKKILIYVPFIIWGLVITALLFLCGFSAVIITAVTFPIIDRITNSIKQNN